MKTVAHIGAWNRNLGDIAIREAMRDTLCFKEARGIYEIDCQLVEEPESHPANNPGAVVVGAGGLLWDKPELESPSGWQWQTSVEAIEALEIPLIVYGLGWTQFPYNDDTGEHPNFVPTIQAAFEKAELFSVRNEYTRKKLRDIAGINPEVILDPVHYLEPAEESPIKFKEPPIGVVWASDKPHMRWKHAQDQEASMRMLLEALRSRGQPILLIQHIQGLDVNMLDILRTHLSPLPVLSLEDLCPEIYQTMDARALAAVYGEISEVFTMRKHGDVLMRLHNAKKINHIHGCVEEVRHMQGPSREVTDDFNERVREVLRG